MLNEKTQRKKYIDTRLFLLKHFMKNWDRSIFYSNPTKMKMADKIIMKWGMRSFPASIVAKFIPFLKPDLVTEVHKSPHIPPGALFIHFLFLAYMDISYAIMCKMYVTNSFNSSKVFRRTIQIINIHKP